jgi:hypothetical protein
VQLPDFSLPLDQEQCVPQCLAQINGVSVMVPDACVQCLFEHESRCQSIADSCQTACQLQGPPNGTGGNRSDPAIIIDAF